MSTGTVEVRLIQRDGLAPQVAVTVACRGIGQTIHLSGREAERLAALLATEMAALAQSD